MGLGIAIIQMGSMIAVTLDQIDNSHNGSQERIELGALPKVTLMNNQNCLTSACRYCRFYRPEGLRGGACQQLGVSVHSEWPACQLALPAFASAWNNVEELASANRQIEIPQVLQTQELSPIARLELSSSSVNNN